MISGIPVSPSRLQGCDQVVQTHVSPDERQTNLTFGTKYLATSTVGPVKCPMQTSTQGALRSHTNEAYPRPGKSLRVGWADSSKCAFGAEQSRGLNGLQ